MTTDDFRESGLRFPEGFTFGSATAAYQIEGAVAEDGRGPSIWDAFSHTPGKVLNGDTGDVADDFYHRVDEDLDLIKSLGLGAYRLSIAWPRIIPAGTGEVNEAGLKFYERVIDGLIARDIEPVVTLYHWDLPQPLQDRGGWTVRETGYAFAEYARVVGERLGDRVGVWTTLNEPWCAAYLGYASGEHAPGIRDEEAALKAVHHLNLAHGLAVSALREVVTKPDAKYSVTNNLASVYAADPQNPEDVDAKRQIEALRNRAFTDPQLRGFYPQDLIEDTRHITDWSFVRDGDLELIHQPIDLVGINYYNTDTVRRGAEHSTEGTPFPGATRVEWVDQPGPFTEMGWNIAPQGLYDLLVATHEAYPEYDLVITENGAAFADEVVVEGGEKRVHDPLRIDFLQRHFVAAHRAIRAGVPLTGYFVWSLMDNFEWAFGYSKRFGLVYVDYETQERIAKDSARWYAKLAGSGIIPE
ncbi:GH1 family beta-glucosidase [Gryllotalpicola ginsengisoli]|uniref:GH1 family beta-glucosidase n=1 Tax=Gryllotalpicola ginsengisoli TaxID=444608 RepID=UPI0003B57476|nr:GH1 family beta-glucosidase [Gryllotalpicola ginsengisoli]